MHDNRAAVYRVDSENRQRRLELQQIAIVRLRDGEVKLQIVDMVIATLRLGYNMIYRPYCETGTSLYIPLKHILPLPDAKTDG